MVWKPLAPQLLAVAEKRIRSDFELHGTPILRHSRFNRRQLLSSRDGCNGEQICKGTPLSRHPPPPPRTAIADCTTCVMSQSKQAVVGNTQAGVSHEGCPGRGQGGRTSATRACNAHPTRPVGPRSIPDRPSVRLHRRWGWATSVTPLQQNGKKHGGCPSAPSDPRTYRVVEDLDVPSRHPECRHSQESRHFNTGNLK